MIINGDTLSELKAVANACKEFADTLVSRGNPTGDANHVRDVHRAYVRYLVLYPDRDGHHYVRRARTCIVASAHRKNYRRM
jgi:hypothetical protein